MPPDVRALAASLVDAHRRLPPTWQAALIRFGVVWVILLAVFAFDWMAMARQWWDISTYNHIMLIPLILGWLAWQRWPELRKLEPRSWWPGLLPFAAAAFLWLLGALSGLDLARQAGVVGMLGASVPLLLGVRIAAGLAFPLCYLAFLVPVGEELVNLLQTITAQITIALTHLSGIPAQIDGVFIDTPAGLFEVAEACSGVKFLIAMIAFGALAANVCFVSWRRRAALMAACLVVPIIANGIRAWGTIYAAQFVGAKAASGFDHIVYGWIFFAVVLALVIAGAWRFFDRPVDAPVIDAEDIARSEWLGRLERLRIPAGNALVSIVVILVGMQGWAWVGDRLTAPMPRQIDLPPVHGWTRVDYAPRIWWEPRAGGAQHRLLGRYRDAQGRHVDIFLALYANQGEGHEAGGFGEGALVPNSPWAWQSPGPDFGVGKSERLLGNGRIERVAVTWYRHGRLLSGSNARLKLAVMQDQLLFRARPTAMLILSVEEAPGDAAAQAIRRFITSTGPLDTWMDRVSGVR